jgi:hypothetical protein
VILDSALVELRLEARRVFPNALFLPGDDPPVGDTVELDDGGVAVVVGPSPAVRGWWIVGAGPGNRWRWGDGPGHLWLIWPPTIVRVLNPSKGV